MTKNINKKPTQKQAPPPQGRKTSNLQSTSDDLQLAISKMMPTVNFGDSDVKQVSKHVHHVH